ncbi:hypothetical protein N665_1102s0020 [Sinapis alba]|nr:hypothetical protein N665_1102s0020 [Sinapis alba]
MRALCNRVHAKDPLWKVAGFIVDDPFADIITIRDVFQCPVLFSFWRVRHAWHKNIIKRCPETETRVEISRHLGQAIDKICRRQGTATVFEGLMEHFVNSPEFVEYFRAVWSPRIGAWTSALQTLPLASQEICAAMELYHYQMKCRLMNERETEAYQRTDWLVDKLGTKVHSYFWLDEYTGKDDFARYWKEEWVSGLTSFREALSIPDSDVVVISSGMSAKVTDNGNEVHVVWSPSSHFGVCSCSWAGKGYICKHMIKLAQVCRGNRTAKDSASLLQYYQTLVDLLQLPPRDSLFRDYAVSLAVSVEKQINALGDMQKSDASERTVQKEVADVERSNGKSLDESGDVATDLDGELIKTPMSRDRDRACSENAEDVSGSEMEMDPLPCSTKGGAEDVISTVQNETDMATENHERGTKRLKLCSTRAQGSVSMNDGNRAEIVARVSKI